LCFGGELTPPRFSNPATSGAIGAMLQGSLIFSDPIKNKKPE